MEASGGLNPESSQGYLEVQSVEAVAKDTAAAVVAGLGFSADAKDVDKAVADRMKG